MKYRQYTFSRYPHHVAAISVFVIPGLGCLQTFGGFLGFNPHCHIIITDGCFDTADGIHVTRYYDSFALQQLSRHKVLTIRFDQQCRRMGAAQCLMV